MADALRYVVLTERADRHHVAIARSKPLVGWVQIVATFSRLDRAERYAEVENECYDNHPINEEAETPPLLDEPPSGLSRVVEMIERRSDMQIAATTYTSSSGADLPIPRLCDAIMGELPSLLEEHPKGVTAKAFSARLQVEERQVRRALRVIEKDGRADVVTRKDTPANHLVPHGYVSPPEALSEAQKAVLAALWADATDENEVRMTNKALSDKTTISAGPLVGVLAALVDRGRIVVIKQGEGSIGTLYALLMKD